MTIEIPVKSYKIFAKNCIQSTEKKRYCPQILRQCIIKSIKDKVRKDRGMAYAS